MFQYQQRNQYFAQIAGGFEEIAKDELTGLGAVNLKPAFRGIHFEADRAALYRINYASRLITRVLAPLITFDCHSDKYLHQTALNIEWSRLLSPENTFSVSASTSNTPSLTHSHYAALKVKDAVCDFFRNKTGDRPSVDLQNPDLGIHLFVRTNRATISIDTSGGSLHKRGYRTARVEAPMSETLAAAVIRLSGWNGERPLADPMSGSGTLLCEAAMSWCRIPAGHLRESAWGFERLPDFDRAVWIDIKQKADSAMRPLPDHLLIASDIDPAAARATRRNLNRLPGCKNAFRCGTGDFRDIKSFENTTLVVNPPYGLRLGDRKEAEERMKQLGDFLKQRCTGCTAYVYAGDRSLLKKVGLKPEWKRDIHNGGLEGVLGKFDLY